jgi:hypothetical protein
MPKFSTSAVENLWIPLWIPGKQPGDPMTVATLAALFNSLSTAGGRAERMPGLTRWRVPAYREQVEWESSR